MPVNLRVFGKKPRNLASEILFANDTNLTQTNKMPEEIITHFSKSAKAFGLNINLRKPM